MNLINASAQIYEPMPYKKAIEIAGRTCYKSEDKITDDSADKFVDMILKNGHYAMLEHGTIYLKTPGNRLTHCLSNQYSKVSSSKLYNYVTTNYRVLVENNWLDDLKYQCEPTKQHEKRVSVRFICSRAIANELVRHRVFSFAQESTRFCNYSKDKFGRELTFIKPFWYKEYNQGRFASFCQLVEDRYLQMCEKEGYKAQEARDILPLALKTEIVMTGFTSDWLKFFELRCAPNVHPSMLALTGPLVSLFHEKKLL